MCLYSDDVVANKQQILNVSLCLINQVSGMFDGKEFCVINGPPGLNKAAIETKIIEVSDCLWSLHADYMQYTYLMI